MKPSRDFLRIENANARRKDSVHRGIIPAVFLGLMIAACGGDGMEPTAATADIEYVEAVFSPSFLTQVDPAWAFASCDKIPQLFDDLRLEPENSACETDADCVMVSDSGSWNACECSPILAGGGVALNKTSAGQAKALLDRFQSPACEAARNAAPKMCDVAPSKDLGCVENRCVVTQQSCNWN